MRPAARSAFRTAARPPSASITSHSAGAMRTNTSERRVDRSDGEEDQREQRRVVPAAVAHRPDRQADEPRQTRPREQHHRDPRGERELVGREHVHERAGERARAPGTEHREEPTRAERRGERDRAEPEPLRDPVGHPDPVHEPVVRPHREQVADLLVRHGAHPDVRVPEVGRSARAAGRGRGRGTPSCRRSADGATTRETGRRRGARARPR